MLKQRRDLAEPLRSFLRGLDGVTAVEMTPVCGSVTIWCTDTSYRQGAVVASLGRLPKIFSPFSLRIRRQGLSRHRLQTGCLNWCSPPLASQ